MYEISPIPSAPQGEHQDDDWEEGHMRAADQSRISSEATPKISFRDRLKHLTWAWYTWTMSTGGLSLLLHSTPHQFSGILTIGRIIFVIDLIFFVVVTAGIISRFVMTPWALWASLTHPTESLFFPCFLLSIATLIANSAAYGIPHCGTWLTDALRICFWIYIGLSMLSAIVQFVILFEGAHLPIQSMTPAWILPIFPVMLSGTLASLIAPSQSPEHSTSIIVAGVAYQGLGWTVAMLVYPLYLGRLMQSGLPAPAMRPGMFIAVGPAGFTTLSLIGMARAIPVGYGYFAAYPMAPQVLNIVALWIGIWIWCLGFWFFAISFVAVLSLVLRLELRFSLSWWAFIFPNVGFTVATGYIGEELGSPAISWVASAMTIYVVIMWLVVQYFHVSAVLRRKIMFPGRDEDK